MVQKVLELTLISAKDLKNVNLIGKMDPYVVVHLSDDPKNKQKTPVHQDAGPNPSWNYTMRFTIDDAVVSKPGKYLVMTLKHEQTFGADKDLGEVIVPLKELLDGVINAKDSSAPHHVTYQVRRVSSGKPQGDLRLSYKLIDMGHQNTSYGKSDMMHAQSCSSSAAPYPPGGGYGDVYPPPPHHQAGSMYPPAQSQGAYPPPGGYPPQSHPPDGYPPQSHGPGGYPPPQSHGAGGYPPPQSHGTGHPPEGYPPQSHGTGGYPPQSHGTGVPYAAGAPMSVPAHGYPQYGGYPPPPHAGYGYGAYPQPGGYAPYPPAGYAHNPQKPQKPKKSGGGLGMGLGAGLLGGAVGGLVLGEMADDAFDVDCDF